MAILSTLGKNVATAGQALGLPELRISEALSGSSSQNQPYYSFGRSVPSFGAAPVQLNQPSPNQTTGGFSSVDSQVLGASTSSLGGSGAPSSNFQYPQLNIPSPNDSFGGGPSEQDVINSEFDQFNSYLNQQESTAQNNFNETKGLYDTQKSNAEQQYQTEKTQQTESTQKQKSLDLAQVRQLLADLSQRNAARVAVTGGGSVSEALGERFGRQAQQRLGNVQDQAQQSIQRVNTFYDNAITKLNETYQANILQAKQSLDDNLSQIRGARIQSASVKQRGILDAWRNYYNSINQAKIQAANFKQQYDLWKDQQDQSLAAVQPFNQSNQGAYSTGVASSLNPINSPVAPTQTQTSTLNPYYQFGTTDEQDKQNQLFGYQPTTA